MTPFSNTSLPLPVLKLAQWHQGGQAIFRAAANARTAGRDGEISPSSWLFNGG